MSRITKDAPLTPALRKLRVLGAPCQEPGTKTKYILLIISPFHTVTAKSRDVMTKWKAGSWMGSWGERDLGEKNSGNLNKA